MWNLFVDAAWQVVVYGPILGAGLPTLFAVGVRSTVLANQAHEGSASIGVRWLREAYPDGVPSRTTWPCSASCSAPLLRPKSTKSSGICRMTPSPGGDHHSRTCRRPNRGGRQGARGRQ